MKIFNYSNYIKVFKIGLTNPNNTEMAQVLFEPLIDCQVKSVLKKDSNPYNINADMANDWANNKTDIPATIKNASSDSKMIEHVIDYFEELIVKKYINSFKANEMYQSMLHFIDDSNLIDSDKAKLINYYHTNDYASFLGMSFLYAINRDNKLKDIDVSIEINNEIKTFDSMISSSIKKPVPITPPKQIEPEELRYVEELYRVYSEKTGEKCDCEEDLNKHKDLKKNFNYQRKNYYSAETIRRELRDTMIFNEEDNFDILKDEIFDGIIDVRDEEYDLAYERLKAVMAHVTKVQTSKHTNEKLLGWVGPAEKKGVCHMLVNDNRIKWMNEENDNENT